MSGAPEQFYRGTAGQRYQQEKRAVPPGAFYWVARLRAEKFPGISVNETVVELGVGLGWNLAELHCARRIGADLEDFLPADLKKAGVEFWPPSNPLPSEFADKVICHHVLEHVENPPDMLQNTARILKKGGQLLVFVPFEKEARYRHYNPSEPNHHLYSWNVQTLGNLLVSQGFKVRRGGLGQFGYDRFAAKLALRFRLGEKGFRVIRRLAHTVRPGLEVRLIASKADSSGKA
jgi:SAM-dependent methyltransferase